eukprot:3138675-Prymnesium_polylepis.1
MGCFAAVLPHLTSLDPWAILLVGQQHHLRQKTRRLSALSPSPMSACRGWRGGVNWAKLGEWGG